MGDRVTNEGLVKLLRQAEQVTVLTGAGISAESGVPTFRDAQSGLWAQYDPTELATPKAFAANPALVWEWYEWRRSLIAGARPNPGHMALAKMAAYFSRFTLITQNVDGLHQRAGSDAIELHGNIWRVKCAANGHQIADWQTLPGKPPACPQCGSLLRPDVVWFGEGLPRMALSAAFAAAKACHVFFSIGTSSLVQPAAALPVTAVEHGAVLVEINPQNTPLTPYANYALKGAAGEVLPALVEMVFHL
ncbi:MAG: NAD-dependent deacylase [Candidatus Promineifilaceae bacterium]